ncbi:hypothetical protein JCM3774_002386 [Rhodotorula dairenensis]
MIRREKIVRKRSLKELRREREEKRDDALRQHEELRKADLQSKKATGQEIAASVPELTEEQLETMYESLMSATPQDLAPLAITASQAPALPDPSADAQSRRARVDSLLTRLKELEDETGTGPKDDSAASPDPAGSSATPQRAMQVSGPSELAAAGTTRLARAIIEQLETSFDSTLRMRNALSDTSAAYSVGEKVPRGLLSRAEYEDLVLACAQEGDREGVLRGLNLMKAAVSIKEGSVLEEALALFAAEGRSQDALSLATYARTENLPISVNAHHHLLTAILPSHPELALQHLRSMEASGHTPLLATYTAVTKRLLSPSSPPHLVRQGWDLYGHTRLVAYPVPDISLYSTMIQACAHGGHPAPERAIDLFVEMTEDNRLPPSELAYNGVIRACAREGSREYYYEALRYMRRMLDENVAPSRHTFHALLEGARRHGDLARARWMLVKMIAVGAESSPNETTLALLLQAYAAHKPETTAHSPAGEATPGRVEGAVTSPSPSPEGPAQTEARLRPSRTLEAQDDPAHLSTRTRTAGAPSGALRIIELLGEASLFYPGPLPQTSAEVLQEARSLMLQVVDESVLPSRSLSRSSPAAAAGEARTSSMFPGVEPSVFLLNSYLAVLNSHGPFSAALDYFAHAFEAASVPKNRYSYELIMRRCELARNKDAAVDSAKKVWEEWLVWSESTPPPTAASDAQARAQMEEEWVQERRNGRHVSKMWGGLIRVLARAFREEEALAVLTRFREQYPPTSLQRPLLPAPALPAPSAGPTSDREPGEESAPTPRSPTLAAVRISSPLYPETAPSFDALRSPHLLFQDLRVLHQRLADVENKAGLAVVTGVAKTYEKALAGARRAERRNEGLWR